MRRMIGQGQPHVIDGRPVCGAAGGSVSARLRSWFQSRLQSLTGSVLGPALGTVGRLSGLACLARSLIPP